LARLRSTNWAIFANCQYSPLC